MKKLLLTLGVSVMLGLTANAQLNYSVNGATNVTGTYTDLAASGTVITTANNDDANSAVQNIGFTFNYNGQAFTQFILNTNGFIKLGNINPSTAALCNKAINAYDSSAIASANPADINIIAALNHDLVGGAGIEYRVATTGTSPNQVCTIQYKNVMDKNHGTDGQYTAMNFQIKLYQTTGVIELVYGTWAASANASVFKAAMGGIKGSDTANVVRVTKASTQQWNTATFVNLKGAANGLNFGNPPTRYAPDAGRTFRFTPILQNDGLVSAVYALGEAPIGFASPQIITAVVKNVGNNALSNLVVSLNITGANTFTNTQTITSLAKGATQLITFAGFTPTANGNTTISVSIPNDDNNANNSVSINQVVNADTYATTAATKATGAIGFGTGSGLLLCKYQATGIAKVTTVNVYIPNVASNIGQKVYGVVLDSLGTIVGKSDTSYRIAAADTGKFKAFTIINAKPASSKLFYAGIAQVAGAAYSPVGTVAALDTVFCRQLYLASLAGGATQLANGFGNFMIQAVVVASASVNDMATTVVYALAKAPKSYGSPQTISAVVKNLGTGSANVTASLSITGANPFTATQTISNLAAGTSQLVTFPAYTPTATGTSTITVNVPNDDDNTNNSSSAIQMVNSNNYSYTNAARASAFNASNAPGNNGMLVCKYIMHGSGKVDSVKAYIPGPVVSGTAVLNTMAGKHSYAVVLDSAGNRVAHSDTSYKVTAADTGKYKSFYVGNNKKISSTFYVGIAQVESNIYPYGYIPMSDTSFCNFFYSRSLTNNKLTVINVGQLMMQAVVSSFNVGIAEAIPVNETLATYPNPTEGLFNLNLGKGFNGTVTVNVFDITGKQVKVMAINTTETSILNIADLQAGVYMLQVTDGKNSQLAKITKQ